MYLHVICAKKEELKDELKAGLQDLYVFVHQMCKNGRIKGRIEESLKGLYVFVRQMCKNGRMKGRTKERIKGFICICTSDVQKWKN